MFRTASTIVLLLAQVVSIFAQGAFMLCVRSDGQMRIELVGLASCRDHESGACHCGCPGEEQCPCCTYSEDSEEPKTEAALQGCDCCKDYPLSTAPMLVPPDARQRDLELDPNIVASANGQFGPTTLPLDITQSHFSWFCGPPGDGPSIHLPTVVLRC